MLNKQKTRSLYKKLLATFKVVKAEGHDAMHVCKRAVCLYICTYTHTCIIILPNELIIEILQSTSPNNLEAVYML